MKDLYFDTAHMLGAAVLLLSFALLFQRRLSGVVNTFAAQAVVLAMAAAWQGFVQGAPHLYITALVALVFKAVAIPVALHRIERLMMIHRTVETARSIGS